MLDLGDLATLIRLTEIEIFALQQAIDGDDEEERNNAGEIIVQVDSLSAKLKNMYESAWTSETGYPSYSDYIVQIKQYPPFNQGNS